MNLTSNARPLPWHYASHGHELQRLLYLVAARLREDASDLPYGIYVTGWFPLGQIQVADCMKNATAFNDLGNAETTQKGLELARRAATKE